MQFTTCISNIEIDFRKILPWLSVCLCVYAQSCPTLCNPLGSSVHWLTICMASRWGMYFKKHFVTFWVNSCRMAVGKGQIWNELGVPRCLSQEGITRRNLVSKQRWNREKSCIRYLTLEKLITSVPWMAEVQHCFILEVWEVEGEAEWRLLCQVLGRQRNPALHWYLDAAFQSCFQMVSK